MDMNEKNTAYGMLGIVILLWGINYVMGRILSSDVVFGYIHISGIYYGFLRYLFGAFTMIFVMIYQNKGVRDIKNEIQPYFITLLLSAGVSAVFVVGAHMSHEFITGGTTSIIINLCPILVFLYSVIIMREPVRLKKLVGFILGAVGGLLFLYNSLQDVKGNVPLGIILAIIAMIAWGGYTIILHYLEGADRYIVMTVKHSVSSLIIIPFLWYYIYVTNATLIFKFDIWSILGILYAGILASGLAYLLYFKSIETLGASKASSFLFLIPFISVLGDFVLQEPLSLLTLTGGIIAIIGVALIKQADK